MGGWGRRGGCWTALPQQGLSQGSVHLGEKEGPIVAPRGSTWLTLTAVHSFIPWRTLTQKHSQGVRRETGGGQGVPSFSAVQVVRPSLTRPVETGGLGVREPRGSLGPGFPVQQPQHPDSQLSASWFVPLPDSPEDRELLRAGLVCGTPVLPALLLNEQDSEPSARGTEPLFHSGERRREFQG